MNINWKDLAERAAWTFVEGFLVALPTTLTAGIDGAQWKSILIAGAMSGLSAVKTLIMEFIKNRNDK